MPNSKPSHSVARCASSPETQSDAFICWNCALALIGPVDRGRDHPPVGRGAGGSQRNGALSDLDLLEPSSHLASKRCSSVHVIRGSREEIAPEARVMRL